MKNLNYKVYLIAAFALVAGGVLGWLVKPSGEGNHQKPDDQLTESSDNQNTGSSTIWTCSMHPQIRQPEPGDCPICGMELIPMQEEDAGQADPRAVRMSPTAMQLANVRTAIAGTMQPVKTVRLNGKIQADERLVFSQSTHIPGRVEELMVNFTGEYVQNGQPIATVYSPDLVTAQEELFEARKIKDLQPQLFRAAKEKLKNWKLTKNQIEDILQSGTIRENFPILADVSGFVTEKMVNTGQYIQRGETIYEIADLSRVWALFDVYESDMPWISQGDIVNFTVASLPGKTFEGKISWLDPVIDPRTRVAGARVVVSNPGLPLKPEMFASGTVDASLPEEAGKIVVPKSAVMWTGERSVVYAKSTSDAGIQFSMQEVTLGPALGDGYIIESGLQEGEEIAVHGTFSIDAAAQLAGKPSMMNKKGGTTMTGHNHGGMDMAGENAADTKSMPQNVTLDPEAKVALRPLYTHYLALKDALASDNFDSAMTAAEALRNAVEAVDMGVFSGPAHTRWMKYSSALTNALKHAAHFSDIEAMRKAFQPVSNTMIDMSQTMEPFDQTLYVQHCPMADDFNGADWLSLSDEIRNPYFGESMLTCGEVTNEIN